MRSIPEDNLVYSLLIKFDTGAQGSGFNIIKGNSLYYVTAKHVLFNNDGALHGKSAQIIGYSADTKDETPTIFQLDLEKLLNNNNIISHATHDVAVIRTGKVVGEPNEKNKRILTTQQSEGIIIKQSCKLGTVNTTDEFLLSFDDVMVGNDVLIYGYPSSIGTVLGKQLDTDRPLLRKGVIAAKYGKSGTIVLDCPVYYGNSGGPAVQISQPIVGSYNFNIIGVVSQFVPYEDTWKNTRNGIENSSWTNSGYSIIVSIDKALELMT